MAGSETESAVIKRTFCTACEPSIHRQIRFTHRAEIAFDATNAEMDVMLGGEPIKIILTSIKVLLGGEDALGNDTVAAVETQRVRGEHGVHRISGNVWRGACRSCLRCRHE